MRSAVTIAAFFLLALPKAFALDLSDDLTITGYGDLRVVAPPSLTSYMDDDGLGKFRYGGGETQLHFAEAVAQIEYAATGELGVVALLRAEPKDRNVVDALEAYLRYAPQSDGALSWSVKAGAFFPTISLENDDLGWASPYTLTPSAINSWIGEELRTIGAEATLRWDTGTLGTVSLIGAAICCNDEAGIMIAERGWALTDRPTGLFERLRLPEDSQTLIGGAPYARTGMFDEIDGRIGWYGGATWQMPGIVKLSVIRYDNEADSHARTARDTAWDTRFWSVGARTQWDSLVLIAQALRGDTVVAGPSFVSHTKFQSAFALASYDWDDWRFSLREEAFATRKANVANNIWSEDGDATTASVSWAPQPWLRLTGEVIAMHSRRGEYVRAGLGLERNDREVQFSTRFFF
jgi:hypothetical protein